MLLKINVSKEDMDKVEEIISKIKIDIKNI